MKLIDAINNIDRNSPENRIYYEGGLAGDDPDPSELARAVGLTYYQGWHDEFSKRVRKLWLSSWICTDTRVGLAVYELDGEVVAVSTQEGRKCDEHIHFLSMEGAGKMRALILELIAEEQDPPPIVSLDEDVSSWFKAAKEN